MALPTILVDSATGSDTAASGAGPGTALTGSAASTNAGGTVVTLDGSPDLSGVATDGSHTIFLNDSTAGSRNHGKITAVDNGAKTVTVANAFGGNLTNKAWAIGGKRASVGGTTSVKLLENNAGNGDAMPGWSISVAAGHTETIAATITWRRAGDRIDGVITLTGPTSGTLPILTFSNNGDALVLNTFLQVVKFIEFRNSNATKTASRAIVCIAVGQEVQGCVVNHATNKFWRAIGSSSNGLIIRDCSFGNCANVGIDLTNASTVNTRIENCEIYSCGSNGISIATLGGAIRNCLITGNSGDGINDTAGGTALQPQPYSIIGCTIDNNAGDGIEITCAASSSDGINNRVVENCILSNNGGYGLKISGASWTDALLTRSMVHFRNNDHYNNTSGFCNIALTCDENTTNNDPKYKDTANRDYTPTNRLILASGYPLYGSLKIGSSSGSYSSVDQGAVQQHMVRENVLRSDGEGFRPAPYKPGFGR